MTMTRKDSRPQKSLTTMERRSSSPRQLLMWYLIPVLFCAALVVSMLGTLTPEVLRPSSDVEMVLNSLSESFSSSFSADGLLNQSKPFFSMFDGDGSLIEEGGEDTEKDEAKTLVTTPQQNGADSPAWIIPRGVVPNQPSKDPTQKRIHESITTSDVVSPLVFQNLLTEVNVKSILQMGCGKTSWWFHLQGVDAMCVQEASEPTIVPSIDHDYRNGVWYPETTMDAVWAVDFLEYVQAHHQSNYFATFRKAAVIFVSTTEDQGTGRVELHSSEWWKRKFKSQGFVHDSEWSVRMVKLAEQDKAARLKSFDVFLNPLVASLPQHAHLFFEHGCYKNYPPIQTQPCQANHRRRTETALPDIFLPFELDVTADELWKKVALNSTTSRENAVSEFKLFPVSRKASNKYTTSSQIPFAEGLNPDNPLAIPQGKGQNQPSEKVHDAAIDNKRKIYGGQGDKEHLGGFTDIDYEGISPSLWTQMVEKLGIKSILDIGCGRGISTMWFYLNGLDTLCAEGSRDAVDKSLLPNVAEQVVEHDFSKGPWWPEKTYDAVWAIEFLEHVGVNYQFNYISAMRKAAIVFVTSSRWGGWHHVEIHDDEWWIRKYRSYGFIYDEELTKQTKLWARSESRRTPGGDRYRASHVIQSVKVFINPAVAALPQHSHLLFEHGCLDKWQPGNILTKPCTSEQGLSPLPEGFAPLKLDVSGTDKWEDFLLNHTTIGQGKNKKKVSKLKNPPSSNTTTTN